MIIVIPAMKNGSDHNMNIDFCKFIFDCETDGLYGKTLSIAAVVYDRNWNILDTFDGAVNISENEIFSGWVKENVYPYLGLGSCIYKNENELLESFWKFWLLYRETALCFTDTPYPVESHVFFKCVASNPAEREFLAPYPLIDTASLLYAHGIDPLVSRAELTAREYTQHRALEDVKMTAEIIRRLEKGHL